jgi:hypothetical protein
MTFSLSYLLLEGGAGYVLLENHGKVILGPTGDGSVGVSDFANTTPGSAIEVVADSAKVGEAGSGVNGSGTSVIYSSAPYGFSYMLLEGGLGYILLENSGKIIFGASP